MLRKYSNSRTPGDNLKLGSLTAFTAGMVNVSSLILFFSFTSNVTGHYAILADEISNGRWFQVIIVFMWIALYFMGSFISNQIIIRKSKNSYVSHSVPLLLEILCFLVVGFYGKFVYTETLIETELLVAILLFSMGLQNGLTASISNFSVKTTHLT
ncbi:MAG: YoaK family protein, partial [Bacteroidota bacterium]